MKYSDDLFQLIHSLTPVEKGYFKKYTSRHIVGEKNGYMDIFECIAGQKEYNENEVREAFSRDRTSDQFPVVKRYLYTLLLRSMRAYHAGNSMKYRLHGMRNDILFLLDKRLYAQCEKILAAAKKLAYDYELFIEVLELISVQIGLLKRRLTGELAIQAIRECYEERRRVIAMLQNQYDYAELAQNIFQPIREHDTYEESAVVHPLLRDESRALSRRSLALMHSINAMHYYRQKDARQSYHYSQKLLQVLESLAENAEYPQSYYISALNNHLILCKEMNAHEELMTTLHTLRLLPARTGEEQASLFYSGYVNELYFYLRQGRYTEVLALTPVLEEGMLRFNTESDEEHRHFLYHGLAVACVGVQKYRAALPYIHQALNAPEHVRKEIHYAVRLLELVVHFQLKDYEYLEYLIRSTHRYFCRQEVLSGIPKTFLEFFKRLLRLHTPDHIQVAFRAFHTQLLPIARNPQESRVLELFDIVCWTESILGGCSMEEIMQQRAFLPTENTDYTCVPV